MATRRKKAGYSRSTKKAKEGSASGLGWTIEARTLKDRVELVKVSTDPASVPPIEEVLVTARGATVSKVGPRAKLGLVGDLSGQRALEVFRIAARKARAQHATETSTTSAEGTASE